MAWVLEGWSPNRRTYLPPPLLGLLILPWSPSVMSARYRTCASHLGLGLIFVLVVEKLISKQHKPALLPVLHDAPLLLQPACLEH